VSASNLIATKFIDGNDAKLVVDRAEIRVTAGPERGVELTLGVDSIQIGSSSSCELVLHDETVSGRHAEIKMTSRGFVIRDLGSTNGVLLAGHRIDKAPLSDGMRLQLGDSTLVVRSLGKKSTIPLARAGMYGELVVQSIKMRAFVEQLQRAAATQATILIEGESGSGKEVAAQALHRASPRRQSPYVVFDCAGATPSLAASELFGHEAGAFTGASKTRTGLIERRRAVRRRALFRHDDVAPMIDWSSTSES
jgi:pSer/pThr/pTyr-binding forkhead associated (FHA) protein